MEQEHERIFVLVPKSVKAAARIRAAIEGVTMSEVLRAFLASWAAGEAPTPRTVAKEPAGENQ